LYNEPYTYYLYNLNEKEIKKGIINNKHIANLNKVLSGECFLGIKQNYIIVSSHHIIKK
jgi:hypothetical protein